MAAPLFDKINRFVQKLNQVDVGKSIQKLNQIDVGKAIKRLREIKVEDLRKLSFSDLSSGVNPLVAAIVGGSLLAGGGLYFLTFPQLQSWSVNRELLNQYRQESEELPLLRSRLDRALERQGQALRSFDVVKGFVAEGSVHLFTSKFFTESARRAKVDLLDITPLTLNQPYSCGFPEPDLSAVPELPPPTSSENQPAIDGQQPPEENPPPPDGQSGAPSTIGDYSDDALSKAFKVNRFKLVIRGDYLNMIAFLRYLNEYQQSIVPLCFQSMAYKKMVPVTLAGDASEQPPKPLYLGDVQADLVVDIPQRLRDEEAASPAPLSASPPN